MAARLLPLLDHLPGPILRFFGRGRLFLPLVLAGYLIGALAYYMVWSVDPYNLRPSGLEVRLSARAYGDDVIPKLVSVAAKGDSDLIVLGGSTTLGFSPAMLRKAFPEARKPVNLSINAIRSDDFRAALMRLEASKSLKKLILVMDFTQVLPEFGQGTTRTGRYLDPAPWHKPVPDFEMMAIGGAFNVLKSGVLTGPGMLRRNDEVPDYWRSVKPLPQQERIMQTLRKAIADTRASIVTGEPAPCSAFPAIAQFIRPSLQRLTRRGVEIELLAPPYSLATFAHWATDARTTRHFAGKAAPWSFLMGQRRCMLEAVADLNGVRMHAFDTQFALTGNLANYYDPSHIYTQGAYEDILLRIARGDNILTLTRWPTYYEALRKGVQTFDP